MQLSDWLRMVVVGGSVVAALGSATSQQQQQPTGYYPRPQGAEGPQAAPAPAPTAAAPGTCQAFCDQLARCELSPASDCMDQCRTEGMEQNPSGPQILAEGARSSCEQLAAWSQAAQAQDAPDPAPDAAPPRTPPVSQAPDADAPTHDRAPAQAPDGTSKDRPQWTCNATGTWQKCEMQGYHACYSQMQSSIGFGTTEALARLSAQTLCTSAMTSLMSANFTYRTNVMVPCRAISCTAPAKR